LSTAPEDPRGLFLRARARLEAGDAQAAMPDLRRYVRGRPDDPEGYRSLARCLDLLGDDPAACAQRRIGDYLARTAEPVRDPSGVRGFARVEPEPNPPEAEERPAGGEA